MRLSRRAFVLLGLAASAATPLRAANTPRRIVICLLPGSEDEAIRRNWATALDRAGTPAQVEIVRAPSLDFVADSKEWDAAAAKIVAKRPDVVVVHGTWLPFFTARTSEIPLVFMGTMDSSQFGVETLRRPGRNVTGVADPFFEMQEKRFELLKELRPNATRIAVMWAGSGPFDALVEKNLANASRKLGLEPVALRLPATSTAAALSAELRRLRPELADVLWNSDAITPAHLEEFARQRVATSFAGGAQSVRDGGLISYVNLGTRKIVVGLVTRILRGEKVAEIPSEVPREFHLAVNLRTAKRLEIQVPDSVLLSAQEVIR